MKKSFLAVLKKYGQPLYVRSEPTSFNCWDNDYMIKISWGSKLNKKIIDGKMLGNNPYIRKWDNNMPIVLKNFRHNGAKTSAKKRAEQFRDKVLTWCETLKEK